MMKCRFCSFETNNYEELRQHEYKCYQEYSEKQNLKRKEELVEDIRKLNSLKQEYEKFAGELINIYSDNELAKYIGFFPYEYSKEHILEDYLKNGFIFH